MIDAARVLVILVIWIVVIKPVFILTLGVLVAWYLQSIRKRD